MWSYAAAAEYRQPPEELTDCCEHSQHHGMLACPGLTQAEKEFGEKVRSVALNFVATNGKTNFHDSTVAEQKREMFDNAKRYGNPPPERADVSWT